MIKIYIINDFKVLHNFNDLRSKMFSCGNKINLLWFENMKNTYFCGLSIHYVNSLVSS